MDTGSTVFTCSKNLAGFRREFCVRTRHFHLSNVEHTIFVSKLVCLISGDENKILVGGRTTHLRKNIFIWKNNTFFKLDHFQIFIMLKHLQTFEQNHSFSRGCPGRSGLWSSYETIHGPKMSSNYDPQHKNPPTEIPDAQSMVHLPPFTA